ncbi:MAG: preprotein translocase subunit SecB [Methylococcaceae bacterium]|nr:preprotein translocase subunit SecB [Methylococcaceae bacterium]
MNITFIDTKVLQLNLIKIPEESEEVTDNLDFSFSPAFSELKLDEFLIIFKLSLTVDSSRLSIEYAARFSVDGEIDNEFKESHFVKINAPAIAYPFLRAYISNLTLNSGLSPVVLPTVNFTKFS